MNERIKQLALQAEQYADDTFNSDPAKYDTPEQEKVWCEMMQEKFAEMIVRECAGVGSNIVLNETEDNDMGVFLGIKQHFGV
jgi:hypothetical protein